MSSGTVGHETGSSELISFERASNSNIFRAPNVQGPQCVLPV